MVGWKSNNLNFKEITYDEKERIEINSIIPQMPIFNDKNVLPITIN